MLDYVDAETASTPVEFPGSNRTFAVGVWVLGAKSAELKLPEVNLDRQTLSGGNATLQATFCIKKSTPWQCVEGITEFGFPVRICETYAVSRPNFSHPLLVLAVSG